MFRLKGYLRALRRVGSDALPDAAMFASHRVLTEPPRRGRYARMLQRACDGGFGEGRILAAVEEACGGRAVAVKSKCHALTTLEDCTAAPYQCEWCK